MKFTRYTALLLLLSMLVSCGAGQTMDAGEQETAETVPSAETTAKEEEAYVFPTLDCGGETFTILNNTTTWGFTSMIAAEELTGDTLNDAIYNRNLLVEETFQVKLAVHEELIKEISNVFLTSVMAGENAYQMGIFPCTVMAMPNAFESVMDLTQYDALHLDSPWWDQSVAEAESLITGEKLYFGAHNINLIAFEDSMCLFMNEDMIADLGLDPLYDKVKEGSWTFDVFCEYTEAAASLNGDTSFDFNEHGAAVYGLTTWETGVRAFLVGMGIDFLAMNNEGQPELNMENDRYYSAVEKLAAQHGTAGECLTINGSGAAHYEAVFLAGRAMFTCAQLKASTKYRDMEITYGIIPLPKYDEAQTEYYSYRTTNVQVSGIPVTNPKPEEAAVIMDAMAYLSYTDTLPIYWNVNMEHKQLRNEESIEMLELISNSRAFDMSRAFGWTTAMCDIIDKAIIAGDGAVASIIASHKDAVAASIQESLNLLQK